MGVSKRRHPRVKVDCFPVTAPFRLKAKRGLSERLYAPPARDPRRKEIGMGQQVGRHECTVAVAAEAATLLGSITPFLSSVSMAAAGRS